MRLIANYAVVEVAMHLVNASHLVGTGADVGDFELRFIAHPTNPEDALPLSLQEEEIQDALSNNDVVPVRIIDVDVDLNVAADDKNLELFLDVFNPGFIAMRELGYRGPNDRSEFLKRRVNDFCEEVCHDESYSDDDLERELAELRCLVAHQDDHLALLFKEKERLIKDRDQAADTMEGLQREKTQWERAWALSHMRCKHLEKHILAAHLSIWRLSLASRHAYKLAKQASLDATDARYVARRLNDRRFWPRLFGVVRDTVKTFIELAHVIVVTIVMSLLILPNFLWIGWTPSIPSLGQSGSCKQ